ncbi:hypothetical protein [Dechloromonas sp. A34]|uniref:hypothetical protein n=1 Tax=Dechloromonas sp. A34 TaxID=447588 RepID=UPI002248F22A|nr:hypothetical protein [Dechloromonas sp. A34]
MKLVRAFTKVVRDMLKARGKMIGVICHVEGMKKCILAQIQNELKIQIALTSLSALIFNQEYLNVRETPDYSPLPRPSAEYPAAAAFRAWRLQ